MKKVISLLFIICSLQALGQQQKMKVITYNIFVGMSLDTAKGKPQFTSWVKKMNPDILALQEVTGFTQTSLEELSKQYGHPYAVLLVEGEKYPVALTSAYPISNVKKVTDNMDRGFIQAEINGYSVIVLHLTPFDYRKGREEIDVVLAHIKSQLQQKNWIIMGDFNALSPLDSLNYKDGRMIQNLKNYEKNYPGRKKLDNNALDYQIITKVLNAGFVDVLKLHHKEFVKTVHPKRFEPKTGEDVTSRIDFIFVSKDLKKKATSSKVIVDDFTDNYSDHYPVLMEMVTK